MCIYVIHGFVVYIVYERSENDLIGLRACALCLQSLIPGRCGFIWRHDSPLGYPMTQHLYLMHNATFKR